MDNMTTIHTLLCFIHIYKFGVNLEFSSQAKKQYFFFFFLYLYEMMMLTKFILVIISQYT